MSTTPQQNLLRFITAGSVDDGKSTLIGRLLYDSQAILSDQAQSLSNARHKRVAAGEEIDFSLLTDGLEAEREQGITIDVAYRYFRSPQRRFIIADTPGHEQYTRNMVTGASTADAAVVLIDAARISGSDGNVQLLAQTRRHSAVVKLLGLKHVIVAVNKMDLAGYDQRLFNAVCAAYGKLATRLGLQDVQYVPVSALRGDNIVQRSAAMPWYQGAPLLALLESLPVGDAAPPDAVVLRLPVQYVAREDGSQADDFRGYMGRIEAGAVSVGQKIRILPSRQETLVTEILTPNGPVPQAGIGAVVTVCLADNVDLSRGDMLVDAAANAGSARRLEADLCWFDDEPLNPARKYLLRHTTSTVFARVNSVDQVFDVHTLSHATGQQTIRLNDIGSVSLTLQKPIACDRYADNPATGAFVLIDEVNNRTLAAGMIRLMVD